MYQLTENGVINLQTGASIPECEENRDWQEYQEWLTKGNTPFIINTPIKLIDGIWTDISQTPEYIAEQKSKTEEVQRAELLAQIEELEKSQARAIREVTLGKSDDFAMGKLQTIDKQINELRSLL